MEQVHKQHPSPSSNNVKSSWLIILALLLTSLLATNVATAQTDLERFQRSLEQIRRDIDSAADSSIPASQRALIDFGGWATASYFSIDDTTGGSHGLRQYDLNLYTSINLDNAHRVYLRGRTSYRDWNTGQDFNGEGDDWLEPVLDRGYYEFDLRQHLRAYSEKDIDYNINVRVGRQLVTWGNGLTLSTEVDGGLISVEYDIVTLDVLISTSRDDITDIDSSRPGFDYETDRNFFGGMIMLQIRPKHAVYVYGLVQTDENPRTTYTISGVPTAFEYNSYYVGFGAQGVLSENILYSTEFVFQGGNTLSSPLDPATSVVVAQTRDEITAFAADGRLDFLFNDASRSRITLEVTIASGDNDRLTTSNTFGGNAPGTTDTAFNSFGLIDTGLAFGTNVSNLVMGRVEATTFPFSEHKLLENMQVGAGLYLFGKLDAAAPIDEPTTSQNFLGTELDLLMNWQVTSDVSFIARYGVFFPSDAFGSSEVRHFFYSAVTISF